MDSWTNEQVEVGTRSADTYRTDLTDSCQNMKRVGNVTSNQLYNPRNTKAAIPMDVDEVDGVIERFIRQKYEHKMFNESQPGSRQNTGSTSSDDRPPPLPPKPSKRFHFPGLRAASSNLPKSRSDRFSPPVSPGIGGFGREPSPPPKDRKHAKFLGADLGGSRDDNFERKLTHLRDMGFTDDRRNLQVLKGLNGNVEKSVETLIRLGEGNSRSRSLSPLPPSPLPPRDGPTNGITVEKSRGPPTPSKTSNPFDQLDVQNKSLPQLPEHPELSPQNTYNPFLQPNGQQSQQYQPTLEQSFQNMQLGQSQFPAPQLFPNSTGGYGNGNPSQLQTNPFLQTYTPPPVPQMPPQYNQFTNPDSYSHPPQQQFVQTQPTGQAPNPFLRGSRSQIFNTGNSVFDNQAAFASNNTHQMYNPQSLQQQSFTQQAQPQESHYNPFQQTQPQQMQSFAHSLQDQRAEHQNQPFLQPSQDQMAQPHQSYPFQQQSSQQQTSPFQQQPEQQQQQQNAPMPQQFFQQAAPAPQQAFQHQNGNFAQMQFQALASAPSQQQQQQQQQLFQPPNPGLPQHQNNFPTRHDKSSILALYNYPQLAPAHTNTVISQEDGASTKPAAKRAVTMPVTPSAAQAARSMNPFASVAPPIGANGHPAGLTAAMPANGFRHVSNESVDFGGAAMMNGRHSPDAFSGLSARLR
jgi:hypothetical protein